jgi:hypothetical protein
MTTKRKNKTFDCISYKHEVQSKIYEETRNMTPEEQIEYFRRRAEEGSLGSWWRKVQEQRSGGAVR